MSIKTAREEKRARVQLYGEKLRSAHAALSTAVTFIEPRTRRYVTRRLVRRWWRESGTELSFREWIASFAEPEPADPVMSTTWIDHDAFIASVPSSPT